MTIAKFGHVSAQQYAEAMGTRLDGAMAVEEIPMPKRATAGSAGYDFVSPLDVTIEPDGTALIPTGIRAEMEPGWVLVLFPRSSLGFKHGIPRRAVLPGRFPALRAGGGIRRVCGAGRRIREHRKIRTTTGGRPENRLRGGRKPWN